MLPTLRVPLTQSGKLAPLFLLSAMLLPHSAMSATRNPGDPLYCQPNEGATFLIVNGTTGVFTTDSDCYSPTSNVNNNNVTVPPTNGTLTSDGTGNYVYTTTSPTYTGLDTFSVHVDTSTGYTSGGPGDFGGGPGTVVVTLNVLPSTMTATVAANSFVQIPIPPGSVTPCPATYGCVTGGRIGAIHAAHGFVTFNGMTISYAPFTGYSGTDTISFQAVGRDNYGANQLNSTDIVVSVTITPAAVPTLGNWALLALASLLLLTGLWWTMRTRTV